MIQLLASINELTWRPRYANQAVVNRAQHIFDRVPNDVGLGPAGFHPWRGFTRIDIEMFWAPQDAATFFEALIPARGVGGAPY